MQNQKLRTKLSKVGEMRQNMWTSTKIIEQLKLNIDWKRQWFVLWSRWSTRSILAIYRQRDKIWPYTGNKTIFGHFQATNAIQFEALYWHCQFYPPWTANQSFKSSLAGNFTTSLKSMPEFKEAFACLCKLYFRLPGSNRFFGLNVCKNEE